MALDFSPDGKRFISASKDESIIIWDTKDCKAVTELKSNNGAAYCVSYSSDGKYIASGHADASIILWDA